MSDDEKEIPFEDYGEYLSTPWFYFERKKKFKLYQKGITSYRPSGSPFESMRNYDTGVALAPVVTTFQPRSMSEMIGDFFVSEKPKLTHLGRHADLYIIWSVTQGRYRSDTNKRVWCFLGEDPAILKLRYADRNAWHKLLESDGFQIVKEVTALCNQLYAEILHRLMRYDGKSKFYKACLENYRNLPEFEQFQSHRGREHKTNTWQFQGAPQGGNKPAFKPIKAVANKIHSVHRTLLNYHVWLPDLRGT